MKKHLFVAAALLLPAAAFADMIPSGNVDAFYVPKSYSTVAGFDTNGGDGFGLRARVSLPIVFVQGEYQKDKYTGIGGATIDTKIDLYRLGAGMNIGPTPFYGLVEYIHGKADVGGSSQSDSGYGAHVGLQGTPTPVISAYGQLGYVKLGDTGDGPEYLVGAVFKVMPMLGIFGDYRHTELRDNVNGRTTIGDYRVGVRLSF